MVDIDFSTNAKEVKREVDAMRRSLKDSARELNKNERANKKLVRTQKQATREIDKNKRAKIQSTSAARSRTNAENREARAVDKTSRALDKQNRALDKNRLKKQQAAKGRASIMSGLGGAVGGRFGGAISQGGGAASMGAGGGAGAAMAGVGIAAAAGAVIIQGMNQVFERNIQELGTTMQNAMSIQDARKAARQGREQEAVNYFKSNVQNLRAIETLGIQDVIDKERDTSNRTSLAATTGASQSQVENIVVELAKMDRFKDPAKLQGALEVIRNAGQAGVELGEIMQFLQTQYAGKIQGNVAAANLVSREMGISKEQALADQRRFMVEGRGFVDKTNAMSAITAEGQYTATQGSDAQSIRYSSVVAEKRGIINLLEQGIEPVTEMEKGMLRQIEVLEAQRKAMDGFLGWIYRASTGAGAENASQQRALGNASFQN